MIFFFNDTATTEIYTLSLHDALPIWVLGLGEGGAHGDDGGVAGGGEGRVGQAPELGEAAVAEDDLAVVVGDEDAVEGGRSEEHTSELQSRQYLVCRLLLEKKKLTTDH